MTRPGLSVVMTKIEQPRRSRDDVALRRREGDDRVLLRATVPTIQRRRVVETRDGAPINGVKPGRVPRRRNPAGGFPV